MAKYENKDGQGVLFINKKKQGDKYPDFTGRVMIDGKEYYLAGWSNKSQGGESYISLKADLPKQDQRMSAAVDQLKDAFGMK